MKTKAVIFDLDGTLLNTLEDLADSCNMTLKQMGYPERTLDEVRQFVGNGIGKLIERALPGGTENPDYEKGFELIKKNYGSNWKNKTRAYDGIPELLEKLNAAGIKIGIVSNKPDPQVKKLAELYFSKYVSEQTAVGETQGIRRKPAPDTVLKVMDILGVSASETVYSGDSDVDIDTAKNAGIPCISVCWGFRSRQFLIEHGASILVEKPSEFIDNLK